jgi:SAM-dependent methyltransferase
MQTMPLPASASPASIDLDSVNRSTWKLPATVRVYERLEGFTDPGEQSALEYVAAEVRGQPVLDIGVGAGRTTPLLRAISEDYTAIDYTREMVDACRLRHAGVDVRQMDARDLSAFANGQFALVVFSFNGIDSVDLDDRHQVLREVHRVLRPGGLFIVSAHNRNGPGHGEQPGIRLDFSWNPVKLGWRVLKLLERLPRAVRNHIRYRDLGETHDQWAIRNAGAHDFGIVVMYTSLAEQKRQLQAAGFQTEIAFDSTAGKPVNEGADTSGVWWFHYVARKV